LFVLRQFFPENRIKVLILEDFSSSLIVFCLM